MLAGSPAPSTMPKFVRYAADCAICCSERTLFAAPSAACPMNCEDGMAGMYWPNVPVGVELYVRLEATVCTLTGDEKLLCVEVSGRISSTPSAVPSIVPKKLVTMSSRAIVAPGSTWIVVDCPDCVASVGVSVKLSWYFIGCADVCAMRASDSNSESLMPTEGPTAGMISELGIEVFLLCRQTGVTVVTETGTV